MSKTIKDKRLTKKFRTRAGGLITIEGVKSEVLWWEKEMRKIFFLREITLNPPKKAKLKINTQ